jgi:3-hydroxyacyl-CoA dehydrogenase
VAATTGHQVTLVELNDQLVEKGLSRIKNSLERIARKEFNDVTDRAKFIRNTLDRIKGSSDLKTTVSQTDLVIEAIVENIQIKRELFSSIDSVSEPSIH